ncbi:MAG: beta-lactamase family protein [Rubellimicrobium sp.]|nr:beta-lactamase family protein [Rubellimicrobium sp.]
MQTIPEPASEPSADLLRHAERLRRLWRLPGVGLGRIGADGMARIAVAGLRARGAPDAVEPGDRWHIGSITKSMTALLLARLTARDGIGLDTPLGDLAALPLHPDLARQSLRALLAHRAGLAANPPRAGWSVAGVPDAQAPEGPLRDRVLAPHLLDKPRPGKFRYSNLGYMLAGHVVEQIGDAPWKVLLRREIAAPLGLGSLGFGPPPAPNPQGHGSLLSRLLTLRGYGPAPGRPAAHDPALADLSPAFGSAGLVHLSLPDLLSYGGAVATLAGGQDGIVPARTFDDLISGRDYAGGWVLGPGVLRHDGSNGLWMADLRIERAAPRVTALVTNTGSLGAVIAAGTSGWRRQDGRTARVQSGS